MKVLFCASECVPFVKVGGLADVVGALPAQLKKLGADVRVILPLYREISAQFREQMTPVAQGHVNLGWRRQYAGILELTHGGVTYYFVDNEYYFFRDAVYGVGEDEGERFAFYCRAVLEMLPEIGFQPDVLHVNDWQAALIPVLMAAQHASNPFYAKTRTLITIHNLQYQGVFGTEATEDLLDMGWGMYSSDKLEFYGACNFLKGGITYADAVTTVSPTYSREIQTPYYGERLDGLIRARGESVTGILNGLDTAEYDPRSDPLIAAPFSASDLTGKAKCKAALQAELGLSADPNAPLIVMITRLSHQKGLDLVDRVLGEILAEDAQFAVLGKGDDKYVGLFNWAAWRYQGQVAARIEMNGALAHRMYAGADIFLMPSLFEPCGLSQMMAMRYGTLPVVRETGGLKDTVFSYNELTAQGNGFSFMNYNAHDMLYTIRRAVRLYREDKTAWNGIVKNAMSGEYGWDQSAAKYMELYEKITGQITGQSRGAASGGPLF